MIDKKELLEKYYAEHPEWNQHRFQLVKDFTLAEFQAKSLREAEAGWKAIINIETSRVNRMKEEADKFLAAFNPEIAELRQLFKFRVRFKVTPEVLKGKLYQVQKVLSYQNPPKIEEIIVEYTRADDSLRRWDPSEFSLDDFEITEIK